MFAFVVEAIDVKVLLGAIEEIEGKVIVELSSVTVDVEDEVLEIPEVSEGIELYVVAKLSVDGSGCVVEFELSAIIFLAAVAVPAVVEIGDIAVEVPVVPEKIRVDAESSALDGRSAGNVEVELSVVVKESV